MRILLFILYFFIVNPTSLSGQCPGKDSLWNRINFLKSSAGIDKKEKLSELLNYYNRIKSCPQPFDSVNASLLLTIGTTYYYLADYSNAVQFTTQALNFINKNKFNQEIYRKYLIRYYYYLSIYYDSLRLISWKNEAIDSCIVNEIRANGDYHYASLVLQDYVRDLYNRGDYNRCINRSSLGETLIHKYYRYDDSMNHIFYFIYYKASALRSLKRYSEGEQFLLSKKAEFLKLKDKYYQGALYSLFGYLYGSKKDYKNAIDYFNKAVYYDQFSPVKIISARVLNEIGMIYSEKLDKNRLSLKYYQQALKYASIKELTDVYDSDSFYVLGNIASAYVRMGVFDSAFYFFQTAFDKIKKGINENDLVKHVKDYVKENTTEDVMKIVLAKADAYLKQYRFNKDVNSLQRAILVYQTADRLLNGIKTDLSEMESKLFWRSFARRLYEHAIEASYLINDVSAAFYFFEKSRAVLLNDQLNEQSILKDNDILQLADLRKKVSVLKTQLEATEVNSDHYLDLQNETVAKEMELTKLGEIIRNNNPLYFQSFFDTSFITLKNVRNNLLIQQKALIEMFEGDSVVYALIVMPRQCYMYRIDKEDYENSVKKYISYISNSSLLNQNFEDYVGTANHLYKLIFNNIDLPEGRIIISPGGLYFPFEALVKNSQPLTYFLEHYAVSYTYSARYLLNNFSHGYSDGSRTFMGIAPVKYFNGLPALSGSDESLKRMKDYFHEAVNLVGNTASKNNFLNEYYKYEIVQLYAHATDSGYSGEPMIYFADSVLSLSDFFYEGKPTTSLIVLSACETAGGKLYNGEGVFSFNRQFAALGIPSSIANLWSVDNESTYKLTELFYKYLAKGITFDIALQKAKLEFIKTSSKDKTLPYYWAAPVLVGKADRVGSNGSVPWNWIIPGAIVLTLFAFLRYRRWNKKRVTR